MKDPIEAAWTVAILTSLPVVALFATVDILQARAFDTRTLFETLGKWPYWSLLMALEFLASYILLRQNGVVEIQRQFEGKRPYKGWGAWLVAAYFSVPLALFFVVLILA